ncbi:MAG: hypothetical protein AAF646_02400 [Pseudomonadota bacterium]
MNAVNDSVNALTTSVNDLIVAVNVRLATLDGFLTGAEDARDEAEAIASDFRERFLGSGPTPPTETPGGNPLEAGMLFYNTTVDEMQIYSGTEWVTGFTAATSVRSGAGAPAASLGQDGDFYIDTVANEIYGPKTGGAWGTGTSVVGIDGIDGIDGQTLLNGNGAPSDALGNDGDFYVDGTVWEIYGPKAGGAWPAPFELAGADGTSILSGTGAPADTLGTTGDFYIDKDASDLYGPKAGGTWPSPVNLVGPQGEEGRTILNGNGPPSPALGRDGDFYIDTGALDVYGPKTAGAWGTGASMTGSVGSLGVQNANAVNITGGTIAGINDLAVADGGTGASSPAAARTNLGLGSAATQDTSVFATAAQGALAASAVQPGDLEGDFDLSPVGGANPAIRSPIGIVIDAEFDNSGDADGFSKILFRTRGEDRWEIRGDGTLATLGPRLRGVDGRVRIGNAVAFHTSDGTERVTMYTQEANGNFNIQPGTDFGRRLFFDTALNRWRFANELQVVSDLRVDGAWAGKAAGQFGNRTGLTGAVDFDTATNGSVQAWTLTGAITVSESFSDGEGAIVRVTSDGNAITWPSSIRWGTPDASAPDMPDGDIVVVAFQNVGGGFVVGNEVARWAE